MKKFLIVLLALGSISAFGESYTNIVCKSSAGSVQAYHTTGTPWEFEIGCNPATECAANSLKGVIAQIPEKSTATYSAFFEKYVETKQKSISKLTLESSTERTSRNSCVGGNSNLNPTVDCNRATACVTVSVEYDVCSKVKYDPETGDKIVTCPSGKVIK